jgi:hypothetical protein
MVTQGIDANLLVLLALVTAIAVIFFGIVMVLVLSWQDWRLPLADRHSLPSRQRREPPLHPPGRRLPEAPSEHGNLTDAPLTSRLTPRDGRAPFGAPGLSALLSRLRLPFHQPR